MAEAEDEKGLTARFGIPKAAPIAEAEEDGTPALCDMPIAEAA
jgi:hypothetical protein